MCIYTTGDQYEEIHSYPNTISNHYLFPEQV